MTVYSVALKRLMKAGYKQGQLAVAFRVAQSTVSGWMKGNRPLKKHRKDFKVTINRLSDSAPQNMTAGVIQDMFGNGHDGNLVVNGNDEKALEKIEQMATNMNNHAIANLLKTTIEDLRSWRRSEATLPLEVRRRLQVIEWSEEEGKWDYRMNLKKFKALRKTKMVNQAMEAGAKIHKVIEKEVEGFASHQSELLSQIREIVGTNMSSHTQVEIIRLLLLRG